MAKATAPDPTPAEKEPTPAERHPFCATCPLFDNGNCARLQIVMETHGDAFQPVRACSLRDQVEATAAPAQETTESTEESTENASVEPSSETSAPSAPAEKTEGGE